MHGNTTPCEALHVRHGSIVIKAGTVVSISLEDGKNASGCAVSWFSCAYCGAGNLNAVSVNVSHLVIEADNHEHWA